MNQREKEEYLREYAILKSRGKPFFPYAVAKDGAMACNEWGPGRLAEPPATWKGVRSCTPIK